MTRMRRFTVYRTAVTPGDERFDPGNYNAPTEPQLEGVVFTDGRCSVRWRTPTASTVAWDSFDEFHRVHIGAHPDYGTEIVWHDAYEAA